jgi:hypothetical protein
MEDSIQQTARRHYKAELQLLVNHKHHLNQPAPVSVLEVLPPNRRMTMEQEKEMLEKWPVYREKWAEPAPVSEV